MFLEPSRLNVISIRYYKLFPDSVTSVSDRVLPRKKSQPGAQGEIRSGGRGPRESIRGVLTLITM